MVIVIILSGDDCWTERQYSWTKLNHQVKQFFFICFPNEYHSGGCSNKKDLFCKMWASSRFFPSYHLYLIFGPCALANKCNRCQLNILKNLRRRKNTIRYNELMFRRLDGREKLYRTTSVLIWIPSRSDDKSQVIRTRNPKIERASTWTKNDATKIAWADIRTHSSIKIRADKKIA